MQKGAFRVLDTLSVDWVLLCLGKSDGKVDTIPGLVAVPLTISGDKLKFYMNDHEDILVTAIA